MTRELVGFLCILWFITGRQMGHMGAKYSRNKKESAIVAGALLLISLVSTYLIVLKGG